MGYRTVVVLCNDEQHNWENDPELGKKISRAGFMRNCGSGEVGNYGIVHEVVHADTQSLVMFDSLEGTNLATRHFDRTDTENHAELMLLMAAAENLGYSLVKK